MIIEKCTSGYVARYKGSITFDVTRIGALKKMMLLIHLTNK